MAKKDMDFMFTLNMRTMNLNRISFLPRQHKVVLESCYIINVLFIIRIVDLRVNEV